MYRWGKSTRWVQVSSRWDEEDGYWTKGNVSKPKQQVFPTVDGECNAQIGSSNDVPHELLKGMLEVTLCNFNGNRL